MQFGEPHPFPGRGSPTRLSASGQQSDEGCSCREWRRTTEEDKSIHPFIHIEMLGKNYEITFSLNIQATTKSSVSLKYSGHKFI